MTSRRAAIVSPSIAESLTIGAERLRRRKLRVRRRPRCGARRPSGYNALQRIRCNAPHQMRCDAPRLLRYSAPQRIKRTAPRRALHRNQPSDESPRAPARRPRGPKLVAQCRLVRSAKPRRMPSVLRLLVRHGRNRNADRRPRRKVAVLACASPRAIDPVSGSASRASSSAMGGSGLRFA